MGLVRRPFLHLARLFYRWAIRRYEHHGLSTLELRLGLARVEFALANGRGSLVDELVCIKAVADALFDYLRYQAMTEEQMRVYIERLGLNYIQLVFLMSAIEKRVSTLVSPVQPAANVYKN